MYHLYILKKLRQQHKSIFLMLLYILPFPTLRLSGYVVNQ